MKKYKKKFVYKQLAMNLYKNTPQLLSRLLLELTHDAEIEMPLINQLHKDVNFYTTQQKIIVIHLVTFLTGRLYRFDSSFGHCVCTL